MTGDVVLSGIDDRPGCSVKDSFADVELRDRGFVVLFEARWLARRASPSRSDPRLGWQTVTTDVGFAEWARAADLEGIVRPSLMAEPTVRFLLARGPPTAVAGAILNETDGVVGVSNVFTAGIPLEHVWFDLPAVIGQTVGDLPIVGYEHGDALSAALASGFADAAGVRIWSKPSS